MSLLTTDGLPFLIDGSKIFPDFRNMIEFELLLQRDDLTSQEQLFCALRLLYETVPRDIQKAVDGLMWFYQCGQEAQQNADNRGGEVRLYDFEKDAGLIFSAFYSTYGISLTTIEFLHWWEFKALFENISEDTVMAKIMQYRGVDLKDVPKYQKAHYRKMKTRYALKPLGAWSKELTVEERDQLFLARMNKKTGEVERAMKGEKKNGV